MLESARKLIGAGWGDEGTTRIQRAFTADPDLIRSLDVGQACYIRRKTAVYVQVARPRPSPLSLPTAQTAARPVTVPPPRPGDHGGVEPTTEPLPAVLPGATDGPGGLDDVLGPAGGGGR